MTAPLSPAAQAVLDAIESQDGESDVAVAVAALRAATDQVVPEVDPMDEEEWIGQSAWQQAEQSARFRFLAIATELKAH